MDDSLEFMGVAILDDLGGRGVRSGLGRGAFFFTGEAGAATAAMPTPNSIAAKIMRPVTISPSFNATVNAR